MATSFFNDLMQTLGDRAWSLLGRRSREAVDRGDLVGIGEALLSRRGEASGVVLARSLLDGYEASGPEGRAAFLDALAGRFGPDGAALDAAIEAYRAAPGDDTIASVGAAAEARRQELFRRLNLAPGGTAALVRMRADLLGLLRGRPDLAAVDRDFTHLFASWFNRGFLALRPIGWTTPANILERIIRYEAVHAIDGWDDLRGRLEPPDRRCFAFFHPQLADEPLIFVEVALTTAMPSAIGPLLESGRVPIRPSDATTAVFYSISNTQAGLAGVSFGHFLIKQVAEDLKRDLPNLRAFVTLSPVPGFARWLDEARRQDDPPFSEGAAAALSDLGQPGWASDEARREALRAALAEAAAAYLLGAKTAKGRPLDPVARFHLGNGARLERINLFADTSPKGLRQSYGIMVNYGYDLDAIETQHEAYAEKGLVAAAPAVRKLLRVAPPPSDPATSPAKIPAKSPVKSPVASPAIDP